MFGEHIFQGLPEVFKLGGQLFGSSEFELRGIIKFLFGEHIFSRLGEVFKLGGQIFFPRSSDFEGIYFSSFCQDSVKSSSWEDNFLKYFFGGRPACRVMSTASAWKFGAYVYVFSFCNDMYVCIYIYIYVYTFFMYVNRNIGLYVRFPHGPKDPKDPQSPKPLTLPRYLAQGSRSPL